MFFDEDSKKILVISNNAAERNLILKELESGFFEIKEADTGVLGLKLASEFNPDLVIIDSDLCDINGLELSKSIVFNDAKTKDVQIVFLSSPENLKDKEYGLEAGITSFLAKPLFDGEIINLINYLFYSESYLDGLKILVVDDSPLAMHAVSSTLKEQNVILSEAKTYSKAWELISNTDNYYELFILDYYLPDGFGNKLCEQLRKIDRYKNTPVIFLCETSEKNPVVDIFNSGASDYLSKPFNKEELLFRIKMHVKTKHATDELNSKIISLKQLNKLKDDFYSTTSNDYNVPIEIIEYESKKIIHFDDLTIIKPSAKRIYECTNLLNNLASDVDELTKIYTGKIKLVMEELFVSELLLSIIDQTQRLAGLKEIKIVTNIKNEETKILADPNALKLIFQNIFSNAIKFTRLSGTIEVILEEKPAEIQVFIKDNGIGIPQELLAKLYNKFSKFTSDGTSGEKGTGLGISIIKELMLRHKGSIDIHSEQNIGTTFQLCFPKKQINL